MDNKASGARQKAARTAEYIIQGIFLILGLITVGCVLVITVYLIIAGIPAIREIGLADFLLAENGYQPVKTSNSEYSTLY